MLIADTELKLQELLQKVAKENEKKGLSIDCKKRECVVLSQKKKKNDQHAIYKLNIPKLNKCNMDFKTNFLFLTHNEYRKIRYTEISKRFSLCHLYSLCVVNYYLEIFTNVFLFSFLSLFLFRNIP